MIDPLIIKAFNRKLAEKVASMNKEAVGLGTVGLLGLGGLGAVGMMGAAGMAGNARENYQYGKAQRMAAKARQMQAIMAAKNAPNFSGGMH